MTSIKKIYSSGGGKGRGMRAPPPNLKKHAGQPSGKSTLSKPSFGAGASRNGVNHMPAPTAVNTSAGYERSAHQKSIEGSFPHTPMGAGKGKSTYQMDAHSPTLHKGDMDHSGGNFAMPSVDAVNKPLMHASGKGPTFVSSHNYSTTNKADHLPRAGATHYFPKPTGSANASGFGHGVERRVGNLRLSGHAGGHRIGKK